MNFSLKKNNILILVVLLIIAATILFKQCKTYERNAWQAAKEVDNISAYKQYLNAYPNGKYSSLAYENISWAKAQNQDRISVYKYFVKQHPQSEYIYLAERRIAELYFDSISVVCELSELQDYLSSDAAKLLCAEYRKKAKKMLSKLSTKEGNVLKNEANNTINGFTPFKAPKMVFVKGGSFKMGSNVGEVDEQPVHKVTVGSFYICKYELTQKEFKAFIDDNSYITDAEQVGYSYVNVNGLWQKCDGINWRHNSMLRRVKVADNQPVVFVSWRDAKAYCKWLSSKTGKNYRLPTEAEWEYAAGGIEANEKWSGTSNENLLGNYAWYRGNDVDKAQIVGTKQANSLGIYDMTGNVWEWCSDIYNENAYSQAQKGSDDNSVIGSRRVLRGGCWIDNADDCRIANRSAGSLAGSLYNCGFRVVCDCN